MRTRLILGSVAFLLYTPATFGQTASDIERQYGKPAKVYSVSEHIWMTPEFTADGQVCMVRLYPKRISANANYYFTTLPSDELKVVLNQLVPPDTRGAKKYGDFATTDMGGGIARTAYPFEKVTFTFLLSFNIDPAALEEARKGGEFPLTAENASPSEKQPASKVKPGDEVPNASSSKPEIVEIWWKDRKCVGR